MKQLKDEMAKTVLDIGIFTMPPTIDNSSKKANPIK